jgi:hypothetical protein
VVLPPPTVPVWVVVVRVVVVRVVVGVVGFATFTPAPNVPFIPSFAWPRIAQRYANFPFFLLALVSRR